MGRNRFTLAFDHHNMVPGPAATAVVQVIFKTEGGIILCYGTAAITVLETESANTYAPGCIYMRVSGTSSKVYVNEGAADAVANFGLIHAADQQSALTSDLTDLTHTAPTADYAIQDLTSADSSGMTGDLTALTHTAPSSPDYDIADLVQSDTPTAGEGFGFVTKDEGNTVLKVIQANKVRIAELETILATSHFSFVTKDEGNTVLKVLQANKVRIAEIETALQALGILA